MVWGATKRVRISLLISSSLSLSLFLLTVGRKGRGTALVAFAPPHAAHSPHESLLLDVRVGVHHQAHHRCLGVHLPAQVSSAGIEADELPNVMARHLDRSRVRALEQSHQRPQYRAVLRRELPAVRAPERLLLVQQRPIQTPAQHLVGVPEERKEKQRERKEREAEGREGRGREGRGGKGRGHAQGRRGGAVSVDARIDRKSRAQASLFPRAIRWVAQASTDASPHAHTPPTPRPRRRRAVSLTFQSCLFRSQRLFPLFPSAIP